ncbi:hypothetical protein QO034_02255 [Sedimentitalea sp. JM2-8]|uniref:Type IV pilus biogenesis n=1 Tax=Sedimentitalea xiamensis TaxID=3050037 RepID=A0ABT7F9Y8_9RHOB|nr:hypothetical protein [Sedimentitalea xiamensis]MDK3071922.1 hypothetical protein [Sedimentitalea xiamensis]
MTSRNRAAKTPANVAKMATTKSALNRSSTDLIGLFGPRDNLAALVRKPNGSIQRVERGDRLSGGRVLAIDESGVMMEKNGRTFRLDLPAS